jgi:putative restriction endonuclease
MKLYVGVTDNNWFHFLAERQPDEVNFWRPGGGSFRAIPEGAPFLFKLHSPHNYIVGGGFFVQYSLLPISLAWAAFEQKNGAPDFEAFRQKILGYRSSKAPTTPDPQIGCLVLVEPFFFAREDWIPIPDDWSSGIRRGKTYDTSDPSGERLWQAVQERLPRYERPPGWKDSADVGVVESPRYGDEYLIRPRLGQGAFRVLVTEAYTRRCAMTGERTLPALVAAHIKPYGKSGPHRVDNGLLLRADLHMLLDQGYLTLTKKYHIEVSRRIKEEFENGQEYYALHGRPLAILPQQEFERPSPEFIEWHNEQVFSE